IACPGAQHLARPAAEVEHTSPRFQAQRCAESGEMFRGERVMDTVSAFGYGEDTGNIHCHKLLSLHCLRTGIYL
ncbi:MAG TPA: hypothetical protein PLE57_09075, partial [Methanoregulaceae archaeon]|nr:hypothetical protein [Methanoregulaceae archaeon]